MSTAKKIFMKIFGPLILAESKIVSNEQLSPHFQFLTIKGKSLRKAQWIPGQKIQIKMDNDQMRSYTPSAWNSKTGEVQTLVYMHGKGPGALWARDAKPAANVTILGPRKSLELDDSQKNIIFFGDETTFGLAHALKKYSAQKSFHFFFESTDTTESLPVLKRFELEDSKLVSLNQLEDVAAQITLLFQQTPETQIILSGKQQSIVALREKLYANNIPQENIGKKVYWGWKDDPNGKLKK